MSTRIDLTPFISGAQESEKKYGVPTSITLGQIILESSSQTSSSGLTGLATQAYNLFGMKVSKDWTGATYNANSPEEENGETVYRNSNFKKYSSYAESIEDHAKTLSKSNYTVFTSKAQNLAQYAQALKNAKYATDSQYANKLVDVIRDNNLTQYDINKMEIGLIPTTGKTEGNFININDKLADEYDNPDLAQKNVSKTASSIVTIVVIILLVALAVFFLVSGVKNNMNGGQ